jgi:chemotaxis protein MotB
VSRDRWLVSYADFITLMFAFFAVLYASATANQKKQAQVSESIGNAFRTLGVFSATASKPPEIPGTSQIPAPDGLSASASPGNAAMREDLVDPAQVQSDLVRIQGDLAQSLSSQIADRTVSIRMGRDGLVISMREAGFFRSGSAAPGADTLPILRKIAGALARTSGGVPYDLRIEGHTDNVPIHTPSFHSNWELSTARATGMGRLLLENRLVPADRISAAGYAEFHPVATNATAAGRAENRRVDLVIVPRTVVNFSAPHQPSSNPVWRKITDE